MKTYKQLLQTVLKEKIKFAFKKEKLSCWQTLSHPLYPNESCHKNLRWYVLSPRCWSFSSMSSPTASWVEFILHVPYHSCRTYIQQGQTQLGISRGNQVLVLLPLCCFYWFWSDWKLYFIFFIFFINTKHNDKHYWSWKQANRWTPPFMPEF